MSSAARALPALPEANPSVPLAARRAVHIPAKAQSFTGFREWSHSKEFPEFGRITFIAGEIIVDMSGEELTTHTWLKFEIGRVLGNLNVELQLGIMSSDGTQIVNEAAGVSNVPDGVLVSWNSLQQGRARFVPRPKKLGQLIEVEGTPDLVIEIVSDSSVAKDLDLLRHAYHRASIPEYWLIDARGKAIDFQILQHRRTGYTASPLRGGWRRSRVFGRNFRLERSRGPMNLWEYRLHVQPVRR